MQRSSPAFPRRRRAPFVAALAVLALGVLGALLPASAAFAAGNLTGRLLDQLGQPAVGVNIELRESGVLIGTVTTDSNGVFSRTGLPDGAYEAFAPHNSPGTGGELFTFVQEGFTIAGGNVDLGDIVVARYIDVTGTIANWSAAMGDVRVDLYYEPYPGSWTSVNVVPSASDVSTDGTYSIRAPIFAFDYTLFFVLNDETSPYVDGYLGGELDDPALATHVTATAGVAPTFPAATLPDAAVISGRVTGGGGPLAGIQVEAENDFDYALGVTDSLGDYTLYVRPGSDYMVYTYGDNDYSGMTYDGWSACGCEYDPVTATLADPAEDIDFDLLEYGDAPEIIGVAVDGDGYEIDDLEVRLFRASGGVWVLEDVVETYGQAPNFGFLLDPAGVHRIQFVDDDGDILRVVDGATGDGNGISGQLSPVPACYAALGDVQDLLVVAAVLDLATAAGACGSIAGTPVTAAPSGGGTTPVVTKPRGSGGSPVVPAATPTPTPTPTAAPATTARPTASPEPTATDPAQPAPASSPDLWWLLWVGLGLLVVVVIGAVVFFVRRP